MGVCANGLGEFLVERRAADQNDIVVADARLLHRVDDDLYLGDSGAVAAMVCILLAENGRLFARDAAPVAAATAADPI